MRHSSCATDCARRTGSHSTAACRAEQLDAYYKARKAERQARKRAEHETARAERQAHWDALSDSEKAVRLEARRTITAERAAARDAMLARLKAAAEHGPVLAIDCQFWDVMRPREQKSFLSQLAFCVGANKKAARPFHMHFVKCATLRVLFGAPDRLCCSSATASCKRLTQRMRLYCCKNHRMRMIAEYSILHCTARLTIACIGCLDDSNCAAWP